jgi:hypothetical protein
MVRVLYSRMPTDPTPARFEPTIVYASWVLTPLIVPTPCPTWNSHLLPFPPTIHNITQLKAVLAPATACSLLVRRGFLSVPAEGAGAGVPLDSMITNLFESSYVHPWLEWSKLRWFVTTYGIRGGFGLTTGTQCTVRVFARNLHPRMTLVPTPARLKRTCV